ncbi:MAG: methyltransferase family protein [Candidatus Hodarchaeota archaeon]
MDQIDWGIVIFNLISVTGFWGLMVIRLFQLSRMGVKPTMMSSKSRSKNIIELVIYYGLFITWSFFLVANALVKFDFFLFTPFWNPPALQIYITLILAAAFQILMWIAIYTMGASYRIGHEDANVGDLITNGIFSKGRNPIYFGMDGLVVCAFLEQPNVFFLTFAVLTVVMFHFMILREEKGLREKYGAQYEEYLENTKKYFLFF